MTHDAPLWTNEDKPTICARCNANREALFALAKAQVIGPRTRRGVERAQEAIAACPLCAEAWKEAFDA